MKEIDLKKASKLLPHGAIAEISFNTRIVQSTVSRILKGDNLKGRDKVKNSVVSMLQELRNDIDALLEASK